MLTNLLISINVSIFLLISILHFYWAFGGTWELENAIPDQYKNKFFDSKFKIINALATLAVAVGLLIFSAITVSNSEYFDLGIKADYVQFGTLIIAGIFLLRSVGDFRTVGFFKKEKSGGFAEKDSRIYSPICLFISLVSVLIYLDF